MAQEGLEPLASLVLSESGLPIAYRAENVAPITQYPGWESNPQVPGLKPGRSAVGVPGPARRKPWDSNPRAARGSHLFSRQAPHPAGWLPSSGGWTRTSGLRIQSAASLPPATAPEFGKEDSNPHLLIQSQGAYRLADSRGRPAGVEPAYRTWEARA